MYLGYFEAVVTNKIVIPSGVDKAKLIIMRGCPGSFKSTVAKHIQKSRQDCYICSTDDYFMVDGVYKYNQNKIREYHQLNQNDCYNKLYSGKTVIVDNTNTTFREFLIYIKFACKFELDYCFLEPVGPGCKTLDTLTERNTHNVPRETIKKMLERFETKEQIEYGIKFVNEWNKIC